MQKPSLFNPSRRLIAVVLAIVAFAIFARSIGSQLVYDASVQITSDDYIHTRANLADVFTFRVMSRDVLDFNRPVHLQVLMVESMLFGRNPLGYHLTSVLLHSGITALLFVVISRLAEDRARLRDPGAFDPPSLVPAALAALVFAAHPANVEAIAEPSFREDPLAALFTLLALFFASCMREGNRRNLWLGAGIVWSCLYAIGSKEIGVAAPVLVVIYFLLFRRRERVRTWVVPASLAFVACGLFVVARFALEPKNSIIFGSGPPKFATDVANFFFIQVRIWRMNLCNLIWPSQLCADQTFYLMQEYSTWASWVIVAAVIIGQLTLCAFSRIAFLGMAIFWGALLPVSNLLPQFHPIADRYLYLPAAGLAVTVAAVLYALWSVKVLRGATSVLTLALCAVFVAMNVSYQRVFSNEFALWTDTFEKNESSYHACSGLGFAHLFANEPNASRKWFEKALQRFPQSADAHCGLALALHDLDQRISAETEWRRAVALDPDYADPDRALRKLRVDKRQADKMRPLAKQFSY